jgi:hypothetical protein
MEVGQGPNLGCSAKGKKKIWRLDLLDVFITIALDYNSSHLELLKDICLRNLSLLSEYRIGL